MTPVELSAARLSLGLTQAALAEALGVTANTVARWERGVVPMRTPELVRIALRQLEQSHAPSHARTPLQSVAPEQTRTRVTKTIDTLPGQLTSFVGRERELAEARRRLSSVRLLTFTGPPGVGKTRLALRVAAESRADYTDGVCFVSLATVRDPKVVLTCILSALGLHIGPHQTAQAVVEDHLQTRRLLLILDNFEQVLEAAVDVVQLLVHCPQLTALVTSRAALRVSGEHEFGVPSLELPGPRVLPPPDQVKDYEAVALLVERALAVVRDFQITPTNAPTIVEICRRLDGLPLAIELAAARMRILPPRALLARLEQRLLLLTRGAQDHPERQHSLRAAIGWSYDLLSEAEQTLFRQLAVFAGGCTLGAVESVCSFDADSQRQLLESMNALVDQSLLRCERDETTEPRFAMLQTIQEYASEQLLARGEAEQLRDRHARYFLALAEDAEQELTGPNQAAWLDRLEKEHANLRAALAWSLRRADGETALRLGSALWRFWYPRGYLREGQEWLQAAIATGETAPVAVRAKALNAAGILAERTADYERAVTLHEASLTLQRQLGDRRGAAQSISNLALVAQKRDDVGQAIALYETGLAAWRQLGESRNIATVLNNLGLLIRGQSNLDRATALFEESLARYRELGDKRGSSLALLNLARVALDRGEFRRTEALCVESIRCWHSVGDLWGIAASLEIFAQTAFGTGRLERAGRLFAMAEALRQRVGIPLARATLLDVGRTLDAVQAGLGDELFRAVQVEGAGLPLDEAIDYACQGEPWTVGNPRLPTPAEPRPEDVLRVDAAMYCVWIGDRQLERRLSKQEFQLLLHLYENRERVCTRQELGDRIWGATNWDPNMLHRLVHRLKRKVEPDPKHTRYIRSVAWIGYRLSV